MKIWSDIMDSLMNIVNNSTFYYVIVALAYVLVICFVIFLIVKNKRKKYEKNIEEVNKKDIDSVDLEAVLDKMQEDIDKTKVDEVRSFEEEQEEKAIISYQELLKAVKKDVEDVTKVELPKEKLEDTLVTIIPEEEPVIIEDEEEVNKPSKFQNSEFISPIYGRVNNDIKYPKIPAFNSSETITDNEENLEKTIIFDAIKDDDSDEFLKALKEFRNKLE